ncbi:MAG TPA: plasmid pRiA4b ORF-3 family protein [Verrucomicrobiae bacterium]|nr:plasmid pRiA4b ORF-3 family protein [Verrucomicrobiae bacterium]
MQAKPRSGRGKRLTSIYQLHVLLNGTQPPIWRRLQVPGAANLGWLHSVLQVAMGWTNSHLHQFICGNEMYADPSAGLDQNGDVLNENKFTLSELLTDGQKMLIYEYDFGDSWQLIVTLEKICPGNASKEAPAVCLAGSRACPPEDCGGISGYVDLLQALRNKKHPEHRSMKEWLGRPFDSEFFDVEKANYWLQKLKWPRVTESQLRKILMARNGYQE